MSSDRWIAAAGAALLLFAAPAAAQDEDANEAPSDEVAPPADAEDEDAVEPDVDPRFEEARARFLAGVALAEAGNCSGAIAEFDASLAIVARPNTLYNIARCHQTLHRYDLALASYREYLEVAPEDAPDRAAVEARLESLGELLGTIEIESNVTADVWLGDRIVGSAPGEVLVPGGHHVLELRAEGYLAARTEVEVTARRSTSVSLTLGQASNVVEQHNTTSVTYQAPPLPAGLTVAMIAATVGALGVGIGFGVHALSLSEAEQARDPRLMRDGAAIDEAALFADVFFITSGVLGAATLAMAFLTDWGERPADDDAAPGEVRVRPLVGLAYLGLRVEGLP